MSDSRFFVRSGNKILGPFSRAQLESLQERGRLKADVALSQDKREWLPVGDFFSARVVASPSPPGTLSRTEADWYYADEDRQIGPLKLSEIISKVRSGVLSSDDLVWREGLQKWRTIGEVPELMEYPIRSQQGIPPTAVISTLPRLCLKCGTPDPVGGEFCPRCGDRYGGRTDVAEVGAGERKDRIVAALLALLLGGLGIHHFYLGNTMLGILYLLFCWTLIPGLIALIEGIVFLCMSGVAFDAKYNLRQQV